ncbi:hypothetical protein BBO99_00006271 [Phytophthora kernoviae]|uniref:Uncharacterized protein n=2 Tax=Phytophthora kernoviae TaxID=325452 RepID=A0A421FHS7_9STRA|nr:hypothetical protein G195_007323 [Phytophthora kernoviae 00238/432]KAG2521230.1 hypothetical protein JM16_006345 [Phytophthora kernoviae]RLN45138.1 hypothetical protein BBI17_006387 [Phytophthora kernoviae]RLN78020.1 hypothetical protein BBO99_00006271 [Phytophthora kernoviae]
MSWIHREAHQKDEQLQKLKEQVETAQRCEQQQLAELTNISGSAVVSRPDHQAASQRFTLLASKYKELDREYQTTKQQLTDAHRSLTSYDELESRHAKLQEAHIVQASLVQRLQRDKQHTIALKKAVRMQEKVIRQFEQAVAQQSTEVPERSVPDQHASEAEHQVLEQQLQTNAREAAIEMNALRMHILELEMAESRRSDK